MAFGILEPQGLAHPADVLGTAVLEETNVSQSDVFCKHALGRPDLILVPTPSDDPSDPLNWSRWRKEAAFAVLFLGTTLAGKPDAKVATIASNADFCRSLPPGTCGPLVAPAFVEIAGDLGRPLSQIAQINGEINPTPLP